ncbi:MAG: HEAT repeat domain-containing protein [Methanomicrobiales archaeon]|nr:HEAT repeat domain-containing protein [Methanomicrobiales archaeon]
MVAEMGGTRFSIETNTEMMKVARDVPRLIETLLYSEDMFARARAAEILGELQNGLAIEPLVEALADSHASVRENAAEALRKFGDMAVDSLIDALGDRSETKRSYAAGILGRIGSEKAVSALIAALQDENPDVRCYAGGSLSQIPAAVDSLIKALEGGNPDVQALAAAALGRMGDARAVEPLAGALASGDERVRNAAAGGLLALGRDAVTSIIGLLSDGNAVVRFYAASLLGMLGDPRALGPLEERRGDADADVREAVQRALERIRKGE